MIINLTKSVPLKEWCKITAVGHAVDTAQWIEFTLSYEAIIGFATELLWMYEDINDNRRLVISTNQLKTDPAPSQAVGFYLTPNNYKEGDEYVLPHIDKSACGDNLGIILDHNSISTKFKGHDLGTAYDYDTR